jgi:hypothetical protein
VLQKRQSIVKSQRELDSLCAFAPLRDDLIVVNQGDGGSPLRTN